MKIPNELNINKSRWSTVTLGSLAEEVNVRINNPQDSTLDKFVGLEHFESGELFINNFSSTDGLTSSGKKFESGDVLFARRNAYLRRASMVNFSGVCSGDAFVLRARKKLAKGFLALIVNFPSLWDYANSNAAGTMSKRVKWRDLEKYELLLPSIEEQQELVKLFFDLSANIDCIHRTQEKLIRLQRAIWNDVKKSPKYLKVKDVAKVSNGTTPSTSESRYWENGNVPWLATGNVHQKFISYSEQFVTESALKEKKSKLFPAGSTLVAMIGQGKTRGKCAKLLIDATINQNFACVTPEKINSDFLFYSLFFSYQRLRDISQGTNQLALNCELVGNYKIPFVSEKSQLKVASQLGNIENALNELTNKAKKSKSLLKQLIQKVS